MNYYAQGSEFLYPAAGDPKPPKDHKVIVLTKGCVCVVGIWNEHLDLGWLPLPKRNKEKENEFSS